MIVVHGSSFTSHDLDGLVAEDRGSRTGILTWFVTGEDLEIVSLDVEPPRQGTGSALVQRAIEVAGERGLKTVVLTATNDNLVALGFWQALGFRLCALRPNAVERSRKHKQSIPEVGACRLPIRDELDLELVL